MNREIKFRAWDKLNSLMLHYVSTGTIRIFDYTKDKDVSVNSADCIFMQYTGLKDKNGVEIYELMQVNNNYRVVYLAPTYVLQDISTGDIIPMYDKDKLEVTGDYSPLP